VKFKLKIDRYIAKILKIFNGCRENVYFVQWDIFIEPPVCVEVMGEHKWELFWDAV